MSTALTGRPELRTLKVQLAAVIRLTTNLDDIPKDIGIAYDELATAIREAGDEMAGPPFARYLTFGPEISLEAGCPISRTFPATGRVVMSRLPGGEVATLIHVGPYERIGMTYAALSAWVAGEGRTPAGPMWEVYLTGPDLEPDPDKYRTEVFIPLR